MSDITKRSKPVVFIGAAGQMCRVAIERFTVANNIPLVLTDINTEPLEELITKLPSGQARALKLDLFDPVALASVVQSACLVVLGAGPFSKTSGPVLSACIKAKVPYLDFGDDVESTQAAMDLNDQAKEAGIPCFIGCGESPGMSNVMAVDISRRLDIVDELHLCWLVGDERPVTGKAALYHLMHIASGLCLTWANGKPTVTESWVETDYANILKSGETLLHETAHPEPVTLPRLFPNATRIRCLGGMEPAQVNGIARGLGNAVRNGQISADDAVEWLFNLTVNPPTLGDLTLSWGGFMQHFNGNTSVSDLWQLINHVYKQTGPWKYAFQGMLQQVWNGETTLADLFKFIVSVARGQTMENHGGLLVRAVGKRQGRPSVITIRTPKSEKNSYLCQTMGTCTGTSCAAFMTMALAGSESRCGVLNPEDWAEPEAFYKALQSVGTPADELPEIVVN